MWKHFTNALLLVAATAFLSMIKADEAAVVSCGSVIKLKHKETGHHLHSHQIAWGSGSGQQSVTGHGSNDDFGSMWIIKEAFRSDACEAGSVVKCGSKVRLEHAQTGKNLHSHLFNSPISGQQEVSAYGEGGDGDTGDNWELVCDAGKKV
jgi:dolichyl-phosphate-mannose--protein O-mannosyl transferase